MYKILMKVLYGIMGMTFLLTICIVIYAALGIADSSGIKKVENNQNRYEVEEAPEIVYDTDDEENDKEEEKSPGVIHFDFEKEKDNCKVEKTEDKANQELAYNYLNKLVNRYGNCPIESAGSCIIDGKKYYKFQVAEGEGEGVFYINVDDWTIYTLDEYDELMEVDEELIPDYKEVDENVAMTTYNRTAMEAFEEYLYMVLQKKDRELASMYMDLSAWELHDMDEDEIKRDTLGVYACQETLISAAEQFDAQVKKGIIASCDTGYEISFQKEAADIDGAPIMGMKFELFFKIKDESGRVVDKASEHYFIILRRYDNGWRVYSLMEV